MVVTVAVLDGMDCVAVYVVGEEWLEGVWWGMRCERRSSAQKQYSCGSARRKMGGMGRLRQSLLSDCNKVQNDVENV